MSNMEDVFWYMMAITVPAFTVILFTTITRNRYVAIFLTFIVFAISMYRGYYNSDWIIYLDALSIVIGYIFVEVYNLDSKDDI
ncbi:DUF2198 family protein [Nosocomiicoccus sp. HMSC067E10]|nr:DUF2198 family protein [Nosocomiicoccus sp. HMSC067E10]